MTIFWLRPAQSSIDGDGVGFGFGFGVRSAGAKKLGFLV